MFKLSVTEMYRAESREEAEEFIKGERLAGPQNGYEVTKASYTHKEKRAKGEVIDQCEVVSIQKVFAGMWDAE